MTTPSKAEPSAPPAGRDSGYAWYVAGLLALTYAVAFIDRQVLNLLVDVLQTLLDPRIARA